jgi:hypothetical protein
MNLTKNINESDILTIIDKPINMALSNEYFRYFLLVLTSILASYTLQPIPQWLNNFFSDSLIFKFFIIFIISITIMYNDGLTNYQVFMALLITIFILVLFKILKSFGK